MQSKNSKSFEEDVDLVIFRNTGPVSEFRQDYNSFIDRVKSNRIKTFNEFNGKADMCGKQYLIDLTSDNFPVIPTIDSIEHLDVLGNCDNYVVKPTDGADSIGLEFLTKEELLNRDLDDMLIQPEIDFSYEVSFYFLNDTLEYALYAPNKKDVGILKNMISHMMMKNLLINLSGGIILKMEFNVLMLVELKMVNCYWLN